MELKADVSRPGYLPGVSGRGNLSFGLEKIRGKIFKRP